MFIRVKRRKSTFFVECEPSQTVLDIKRKVQGLSDVPIPNQRLILLPDCHILDDGKTLAQQRVENDDIVALTLRKDNGQWEDIDIESMQLDDD